MVPYHSTVPLDGSVAVTPLGHQHLRPQKIEHHVVELLRVRCRESVRCTLQDFEVSGKHAHAMIRGSQLEVLKGAPHGFAATHSQQLNDMMLGFLRA